MGLFRRLFGKTKESELSYGEKRGKLKEGRSGDDAPCRGDREFVCERVEQAVAESYGFGKLLLRASSKCDAAGTGGR